MPHDPSGPASATPVLPLTRALRRMSGPVIAFWLSLAWLALVVAAAAVLTRQGQGLADALGLVVIAMAVFLPVVLIWLAVLVLRAADAMQDQALRIEGALNSARLAAQHAQQAHDLVDQTAPAVPDPSMTLFVSRRDMAAPGPATGAADVLPGQKGLGLDAPRPGAAPLGPDDLIRALDFPRDATDAQGFDVLRRALHDPGLADLIRAAQEVLAGLSAEGVELRDLSPDRARPELWRAFAQGLRGPAIAALGGVRDRSVLALTVGRMRADPAFRDAAHRFLRAFDRRLTAFEGSASDAQMVRLAETRAARAFMVLGRVSGVFG